MLKKHNTALMVIVSLILISFGCATIMHGTSQDIGISSTPSGASVTIDGKSYGKTPVVADLRRKDNHIIKIEMPGYKPFEATVVRRTSGWVWGNILFGGLIGLAVDAISGGLYKLTPDNVAATLEKEDAGFLYKEDAVYIAVVVQPDPTWQKIGSLLPIETH